MSTTPALYNLDAVAPRLNPSRMAGGDGWYTPRTISRRARTALGGVIDIDPCAAIAELDTIEARETIVQCGCKRAAGRIIRPICEVCGRRDGDGLAERWGVGPKGQRRRTGWINPPYSDMRRWHRKIIDEVEAEDGLERALALVPLRPSSRWWRELASRADFIGVPRSRIPFIDGSTGRIQSTGRIDLTFFGWRLADPDALEVMQWRVIKGLPGQVVMF